MLVWTLTPQPAVMSAPMAVLVVGVTPHCAAASVPVEAVTAVANNVEALLAFGGEVVAGVCEEAALYRL